MKLNINLCVVTGMQKSCDSHLIHHSFLALSSMFEIIFVDFIISGESFFLFQVIHFRFEHAQLVRDELRLLIVVQTIMEKSVKHLCATLYNVLH